MTKHRNGERDSLRTTVKAANWSLKTSLVLMAVGCVIACGCPDTSYQRPVPDYENMTDSGE